MQLAQIGPEKWVAWNFDSFADDGNDPVDATPLQVFLPLFIRVRELTMNKLMNGQSFLKCIWGKWKRHCVPCTCFFCVLVNGVIP